jgi:hypothetical protein
MLLPITSAVLWPDTPDEVTISLAIEPFGRFFLPKIDSMVTSRWVDAVLA